MFTLNARTARGCLALAAFLLALLALPTADADARAKARTPRKAYRCAAVTRFAPRTGLTTQIAIVRIRGVACRGARRIVQRCMRGRLHKNWRPAEVSRAIWLRRGRRAIALRTLSGKDPRCITRRLKRPRSRGLLTSPGRARPAGQFGPYQGPSIYPENPRSPHKVLYHWDAPVATYSASILVGSVSTVTLTARVRNLGGEVRSVWFEYGTTRDLGRSTERQPAAVMKNGYPVEVQERLAHLRARTRYWWRAVANIDDPNGKPRVHYGALASFVTNPYPTIANPARPCQSRPVAMASDLFELTESLAIACSDTQTFSRGACFPSCADYYSGRLQCTRDFPRNLNAGSRSFTIPEIGIAVSVNKLVSYWRSNDSNRFRELPGLNKNSEGGNVGPTPGWHDWDVAQWAYPATSTKTTAEFWINCTEQWGTVIDASSLARGQGSDWASSVPPSAPREVRATATEDGGIDVSWKAPSEQSPSGIAGYALTIAGWRPQDEKVFLSERPTMTTANLNGHIPAAQVRAVLDSIPAGSGYQGYVAVGAVSREGSIGPLVTIPWPR